MSAGSVDAMSIPGDDEWDPDGRRCAPCTGSGTAEHAPLGKAMRSTFRAVDGVPAGA